MHIRSATESVPGHENEDAVFMRGDVVGVFDGVTRPSGLDTGCVHSVAWYVSVLTRSLANAVDSRPDAPLAQLLGTAIDSVRLAHGGLCDLENPNTSAATVALLRPTPDGLDYLVLCDAFIVHDDGTDVGVVTDPRFENAIARVRTKYLTGTAFDTKEHVAQFRAAAEEKQRLTNTEAGYWIAAATPQAAHHAVTGTLSLTTRRIALLTDGASRAVDVFGLFDWRELLNLISEDGPEELIRQVRKAEREDDTGTSRPRFKKHDDATAVLCTFGDPE
jgi:hypothetical protein